MSDPSSSVVSSRARAIEAGLLAPCCWTQTLDVHDSEIARQLRQEIVERLAHHESSEQIRSDLVARYGQPIVAVPRDSPLPLVAPTVVALLAVLAVIIALKARTWRRAAQRERAAQRIETDPEVVEYDEAISRELRALDS